MGVYKRKDDFNFTAPVDLKSSAKKARELVWQIRSNSEFKKKARAVYELHGSRKRR